jgi:hypothetical protein
VDGILQSSSTDNLWEDKKFDISLEDGYLRSEEEGQE